MSKLVNINNNFIEIEDCVYNGEDELDDIINIESEEDEFIREYIESTMDSYPDDENFDKVLVEAERDCEVIPSCMTFDDFCRENLNPSDYEILSSMRNFYTGYMREYRKELRDWWFKRKEKNAG